MQKKTLILGSLVALLGISGVAIAGGPPHGRGLREVMEALDLSEDQQAMAKELGQTWKERAQDRRDQKEEGFDTFMAELAKEKPNAEKLHGVIDAGLKDLSKDMHDSLDEALEFHATLSAEQRAELVEQLEQKHEERKEHGPPGGKGPHGPPHEE